MLSRSPQNTAASANARGSEFVLRGISALECLAATSSTEDRTVATVVGALRASPMTCAGTGAWSAPRTVTDPGVQLASLNRTRAGGSARLTQLMWPSVDGRPFPAREPQRGRPAAAMSRGGEENLCSSEQERATAHSQNVVVRGGWVRVRSYAARTSSLGTASAAASAPVAFSDSGRCPRSSAASVEVGIPAAAANSGCVSPARMRRSDSNASDRSMATTAATGASSTLSTATSLSICGEDEDDSQYRMAFSLTPATLPSSPGLNPRERRKSARACGSKPLITFRLNRRTLCCGDRSRRSILSARLLGVTLCNYNLVCYFEVSSKGCFAT